MLHLRYGADAARLACKGDSALLLHVIPAAYPSLEPALGLGGEGVFTSVPDPEAEELRVRLCSRVCFGRWLTHRRPRTQREAAEKFIANKLVPVLKDVPGINVRHAVLRFATDADSVGRVICTNAEELGAAMVILPTHGKGAPRERSRLSCARTWSASGFSVLTCASLGRRPPARVGLGLHSKLLHASLPRAGSGAALRPRARVDAVTRRH